MKKNPFWELLYDLASPLAMILAGLVLTFCPDAAAALVCRLLGWCITAVAVGYGIGALVNRSRAVRRGITAVGLACIGGFLSANPLVLAAFIGKIIGAMILVRGLRELFLSRTQGGGILALVITASGAALILLPMTASRLLFSGCGLVVLLSGVLLLIRKLRSRQLPPGRPDIIDAL